MKDNAYIPIIAVLRRVFKGWKLTVMERTCGDRRNLEAAENKPVTAEGLNRVLSPKPGGRHAGACPGQRIPAVSTASPLSEMNTAAEIAASRIYVSVPRRWPGLLHPKATMRLVRIPMQEKANSMSAARDEQKSVMRRLESWKDWKFPEKYRRSMTARNMARKSVNLFMRL